MRLFVLLLAVCAAQPAKSEFYAVYSQTSYEPFASSTGAIYFAKKYGSKDGACFATTAEESDLVAPIYDLASK